MKVSILTLLFLCLSMGAQAEGAISISLKDLDSGQTIHTEDWQGAPLLILFWREDCPACLEEIKILPAIAKDNHDLAIGLILLSDDARAQEILPPLPRNVHIWQAPDIRSKKILLTLGNWLGAIPYSVMLNQSGALCQKNYGLLPSRTIKEWTKECAK